MADKTLTSANCTFAMAVSRLYLVPQVLSRFVADNPFSTDDTVIAETVRSLDGNLSAGYVYSSIMQSITILPNSESARFMSDWMQASRTDKDVFRANGTLTLTGMSTQYILSNGVLISGKLIPDSKKMLEPITFKIEWEDVVSVAV
jgi:hypothetical protein